MEFASKGVAGTGLGLGIAGTALGLLNGSNGNGILSGLWGNNCNCSENCNVNRYELAQEQKIATLESQIALRDANIYNDSKMLELYKYVDGKFAVMNDKWTDQAVYNATNTATISCMASQIAQLQALTKIVIPITNVCPQPAVATTPTT